MHQGLCCCCFWLCLSPGFLGGTAAHSQGLYRVLFLEKKFSGGAVALGPNNLWSTPPIQKSTTGTTLREFPFHAEMSGALQTCDGIGRVYLHCTPPGNGVQMGQDMETDTKTNLCIPDTGWAGICQQAKILVPPWELVLGFFCAMSKWSRLIQTTLGCAACCT